MLYSIGLYESLSGHNEVFDPMRCASDTNFLFTVRLCLAMDILFISVNALIVPTFDDAL